MANSRNLALLAFVVLAGCAGMESAGRNANEALPPPPISTPAPRIAPAPPPQAAPAPTPSVAAPNVQAPPAPAAPRQASGEEVIVPGQRERQIAPPNGDPRTATERQADIHAWDVCVTRVQGRSDPMEPQLDSPEDVCRRSLGMGSRTAVPDSRRP
jgi:hypothetical protein